MLENKYIDVLHSFIYMCIFLFDLHIFNVFLFFFFAHGEFVWGLDFIVHFLMCFSFVLVFSVCSEIATCK